MRAPIQAIRWPGVCAVERNGVSSAAQTPGAVGAGAERGALATGLAAAVALGLLAASAGAAAAQTASEPRLLVLLRDASALAVVDPAERTVLGQVPTVGNPHEVAATPDGRLAFVASPSEGISVIDLESMTEVRRLDVGAGSVPHDVRFVDDKLYFTFEDPNRLAFTPDGARVLVSDSATSVVVMDAAARTEIKRFDLAPNALLVRPDGAVAYAALRGDDRVAVIDLETLEMVDQFATGAGSGPGCMFWLTGE